MRNTNDPVPVILHATLITWLDTGGIGLKDSTHKLPRLESMPVSNIPL